MAMVRSKRTHFTNKIDIVIGVEIFFDGHTQIH